jgi:hypothetical protein
MTVIFIQKSWLSTIGKGIADLFFSQDLSNDHISVVAESAEAAYPFLEAKLLRKKPGKSGELFLRAKIPIHLVSGTFDIGEEEATREYGFVPLEKKKG